MSRALKLFAELLLLIVVASCAAVVIRDYSRYADHYPYIATDDGLANVSYALATEGRYGFLTSPVQGFTDLMRDRGFFNYGPWYFYAGAGLIWLFGYSLEMLRAMHLAGILAIAAAACWWFGRRGHFAAGALVALGLVHAFALAQWPMFRPDIAVSVFAVLFIVAAGLAIDRRSAMWWFVAALGAGCAALTHLIAWALVPCCLLTLAIALVNERPSARRIVADVVAVAAGLAGAAAMFYSSFGFRIGDHLSMLRAYSTYLGSTPVATVGRRAVLAEHLQMGFYYLSPFAQAALALSVAATGAVLAAVWLRSRDVRTRVFAVALPPFAVLLFYGLSLASYSSHHTGYVILLQVTAWWCSGALASVALSALAGRPRTRNLAAAALAGVVLLAGVRLIAAHETNPRLALVTRWVGIHDYLRAVDAFTPPGAVVWGTAVYGVETPGRREFVEYVDAVNIIQRSRKTHLVDSAGITPEYLVWAYARNRDNFLETLQPAILPPSYRKTSFGHSLDLLGSVRYRIIGLIAAPPYGVVRVYERIAGDAAVPAKAPAVSAYDVASQSWHERLDAPVVLATRPISPVVFDVARTASRPSTRSDRSVVTELAPGRYLLRVRVARSSGSSAGTVVTATSGPSVSETVSELGPSFDVGPYAEGDTEAYLVREHSGGPLYVSQFDNGHGAAITGVDAYRIRPRLDEDQVAARLIFHPVPPLAASAPGVRATPAASGELVVEGDASQLGYQIVSPRVPSRAATHVTVRAAFSAGQGHVCLGALNGTGGRWLANAGDPSHDFAFEVDATAAFQVVFYNCNPSASGNVPSRFAVSRVQYAAVDSGLYVDRLLAIRDPARAAAAIVRDSRVRTFPAGLVVTSDEAGRVTRPLSDGDMSFKASTALIDGDGWTFAGKADGAFSYALKSKPQTVDDDRRLVAHVRVRTGGVTVGLLQNEQWAGQVNLTTPGDFIAVLEPPGHGVYDVVVANNLSGPSPVIDVTVTSLGWVAR